MEILDKSGGEEVQKCYNGTYKLMRNERYQSLGNYRYVSSGKLSPVSTTRVDG